jgi:hypothetical protein
MLTGVLLLAMWSDNVYYKDNFAHIAKHFDRDKG